MSGLEWRKTAEGAVEMADGRTDTYLITSGHYATVLTRWASDGTPGEWWVAAQAAVNAISLGCPDPRLDETNRHRLRGVAAGFEAGLDFEDEPAWRRP